MKRILYTLLAAASVLLGNYFFSNGTFEANVETPTPISTSSEVEKTPANEVILLTPTITEPPVEERDPYGEVYFSVIAPDISSQTDPTIPIDDFIARLVRLPGSCVVGLIECPALENVPTPFDMQDVLIIGADLANMKWSPDGRYGALVIHPQDDFTKGWSNEEWEQFKQKKLEDIQISSSTLYLFDAQTDKWRELYRADRKFFYSIRWSPYGEWIAFTVASSEFTFHPMQSDDGAYIVHPDGSGLKNLGGKGGFIHGWIGNSLLLERPIDPASGYVSYVMEMLSMDGEVKPMFESSRIALYSLAPDGGMLLAADGQSQTEPTSFKAVDALALDGSVIRSFGTFINHTSMISPLAWSRDGSVIAFPNMRRVYVAPRDGPGLPKGAAGVPPETREVYAADDTTSQPQFFGFEFSSDNKYLVMQLWDGMPRFMAVALDTGQVIPLNVPELDPYASDQQVSSFSWRP
jgi:WD40 repeat protein